MILKPASCSGCPFEKKGTYFTPDHIVPGSTVMFIAQNPGPDEEAGHKLIKRHWQSGQHYDEYEQIQPQPLIGATGQLFDKRFLPLSNLTRSEISIGNAIRCRPGSALGLKADELPNLTTKMKLDNSKADIVTALRHCRDVHLHVPDSTQLIVTMGRYAMFQLTGIQNEESEYGHKQGVMESWRGYGVDLHSYKSFNTVDTSCYHPLCSNTKLFMTMHIAALYKEANKRYFHAVLQDFFKIKRLLNKQWPLPLPTWSDQPPTQWPTYAAFDTEYYPENNQLIRWSLCDTDNNLYCVESGDDINIPIYPGSTVLTQNALADIGHLANIVDISHVEIEDMMLADSVLWTGEPHSLNFIASKHGAFNKYKHLSKSKPQLYSALDAYEPMYMWKTHYLPQFEKDKQSWIIYKKYRLPLIHVINKAQQTGAKVNTARLREVQMIFESRLQQLKEQAQATTGDPTFHIGGMKRVKEEIYG